jgi:hypothetical protein
MLEGRGDDSGRLLAIDCLGWGRETLDEVAFVFFSWTQDSSTLGG